MLGHIYDEFSLLDIEVAEVVTEGQRGWVPERDPWPGTNLVMESFDVGVSHDRVRGCLTRFRQNP